MDIPQKIEAYESKQTDEAKSIKSDEPFHYKPNKDELILVFSWFRYPDYDFIFGIPDVSNKHYDKEVAFFQFRDTRTKEVRQGFYIDCGELEEMVQGFGKLFDLSRVFRPDMWKKHNEKNRTKK